MAGNLVRPKNVTDAQWQQAVELYNAAKRKGDRYPELTVAQAALETGWFKSPSGKYNYFGQKAKASEKASTLSTREVSQGKEYTTSAKFKDYNSIDEAVTDRIKKWGSKYKDASTIDQAIGSIWQYDPKTGSGKGYATDSNYGYKLKTVLNSMGVSSSQSNNPVAVEEEEQETSTYKPYISYLQENAGTIETAGKYSEPKEVTEAKKEIYQAQQEENFLEALSNLQQQPQQTAPQQEQSYLENPELFQLAQVPQIQYEQDGGIIKDNKWLQDWYATRVIPNKDIQGAYLEDKPIYTERLKNIPPVTKVDMIDNSPQKTGQYQGDTGKILMTPKAQPSVYTHEVNHYLNDFPSTMRTIHENIVEQNMYKKGDLRLGVNNENYDYLRNPDEIHSRVQVLRKDAGFRPDEEITEDRLYNYLQNYKGSDSNILELMNLTDDKGLLDMLNYMAYNPKKNSAKENYAESGGIIKDNNGYWNPNNWGKTVEISSPSITMKGVGQPLVGYAPETGETKIMLPGEDYFFKGANRVIESQLIK